MTLSVRELIRFGWHVFAKRPWFFIGLLVVMIVAYGLLSAVTDPANFEDGFMAGVASLASFVLGVFLEMLLVNFALKAHDSAETLRVSDAWAKLPFWQYFAAKILTGIIVTIGFILLIVPGVILALMFMFVTYLVIDKDMGPIEAMKESARITKGHRWKLFLFMLALTLLNIVGVLLLLVGLLVTVPVTILATAHAYRALEHAASEVVPLRT